MNIKFNNKRRTTSKLFMLTDFHYYGYCETAYSDRAVDLRNSNKLITEGNKRKGTNLTPNFVEFIFIIFKRLRYLEILNTFKFSLIKCKTIVYLDFEAYPNIFSNLPIEEIFFISTYYHHIGNFSYCRVSNR